MIYEQAEIIEPDVHINLRRDPKDNIFLDVAITGRAPYIVTEDNDLKDDSELKIRMRQEYGIQIVSLSEFLAILASGEQDRP